MPFTYLAYGIPVISSIELPALFGTTDTNGLTPIIVEVGTVAPTLRDTPLEQKPFTMFNEQEFRYEIPEVARYYVSEGNQIVIEPLGDNWDEILLYVYCNCLAAALFQRNLIPFHVSGVFIRAKEVLLFAAPSRTGKSTTALMLQHKGYAPFTDDTALLVVKDGHAYAQASYPMMRLWQNTIEQQSLLQEVDKQQLFAELNKYGFAFHEQFVEEDVKVAGIVFLEEEGTEITIEKLKPKTTMQLLGMNIYRRQWLNGMKKQLLQFKQLTTLANAIPAWKAVRPQGTLTFESFATSIDEQIIQELIQHDVLTQ